MTDYETTSTSLGQLSDSGYSEDPPRPEGAGWRLISALPWGGASGEGAIFYWERPIQPDPLPLLTEKS